MSDGALAWLESALAQGGIPAESLKWIGEGYLIWDEKDMPSVKAIFADTFGEPSLVIGRGHEFERCEKRLRMKQPKEDR